MFWMTYMAALIGLHLPSAAAPTPMGLLVWRCSLASATGWVYQLQIQRQRDGAYALIVLAPRGAATTHMTGPALRGVLRKAFELRAHFDRACATTATRSSPQQLHG